MNTIFDLKVKIYADGADKKGMLDMYKHSYIKGFTTNPTLMQKAGIRDYKAFALDILNTIPDRSISFEVFSDDFDEMYEQALEISTWGKNVYVKIPVSDTKAHPSYDLIQQLANKEVKMNVTALMTEEQAASVSHALKNAPSSYISIFAGRIADTGRDPLPMLQTVLKNMRSYPQQELIWASPRELLNIFQANDIGCHIITVTNDILKKLPLVGKDLNEYSLETVEMFYKDAKAAGFTLQIPPMEAIA